MRYDGIHKKTEKIKDTAKDLQSKNKASSDVATTASADVKNTELKAKTALDHLSNRLQGIAKELGEELGKDMQEGGKVVIDYARDLYQVTENQDEHADNTSHDAAEIGHLGNALQEQYNGISTQRIQEIFRNKGVDKACLESEIDWKAIAEDVSENAEAGRDTASQAEQVGHKAGSSFNR